MVKFRHFSLGGQRDVNMTEGNIARQLIDFAVPLLIGNIFQQLYNTVDTWVVGNYVSNVAFSAVGSVGPIINMLIGFFLGLSSGASVVIAQYYGARKDREVHDTVHTAILMTLVLGVVFTILGLVLTPTMLRLMKTPEEVLPESAAYLTIYFSGVIGLMLYNIGSGILRAVGDSTRPFYFLVVSAVINTGLDLLFVLVFDMGVSGVALATIIAQGVSAALVIVVLMRSRGALRLRWKDLRISWSMLSKILRVGIPAAIQMAITAFSNVFVQSYINVFGSDCMAGWTAYSKIDQLIVLPMQSISLAATTFVGQNLGSNLVERAQRGSRTALWMALGTTGIVMLPVLLAAPWLVAFFNSKAEVVEFGTLFLRYISPFYLVMCVYQVYAGALRGAGNSRVPMILMLLSFVAFRQAYLYVVSRWMPGAKTGWSKTTRLPKPPDRPPRQAQPARPRAAPRITSRTRQATGRPPRTRPWPARGGASICVWQAAPARSWRPRPSRPYPAARRRPRTPPYPAWTAPRRRSAPPRPCASRPASPA